MQKCAKLAESNVIEYVTDESSEQNGTRLIVGFLDGYSLQSKVLPLLNTNITYNFHAMERSANGSGAKLRHFNILDYIVEWIAYRRDYETKILKLEDDRLHKQLSRESARAVAIENIDAILRVLKNKNIDTANLAFELKTAIYGSGGGSVTMEQAEYILDTDLRALARANLGDQKQKIKDTSAKIKEVKLRLSKMTKVLEEKFTKLDRYFRKDISLARETELRTVPPKIEVTDESSHFIGATTAGKVFRFGDLPMRKANWNWDAFVETGRFYAMVESSGIVRQIPTAKYPDGDTECRGVVGVIPSKQPVIVGINKDGLGAAVENPQRLNEYRLLKHKEPLTAAVGMSPGDTLLVWNKDAVQPYEFDELKVTRRGTMGWRLLARRHYGIRLAVIPEGGCIFNNQGEEIAVSEARRISLSSKTEHGRCVALLRSVGHSTNER
jgi:hypothetical protein